MQAAMRSRVATVRLKTVVWADGTEWIHFANEAPLRRPHRPRRPRSVDGDRSVVPSLALYRPSPLSMSRPGLCPCTLLRAWSLPSRRKHSYEVQYWRGGWSRDFRSDFSSRELSLPFGIQLRRVRDIRVAGGRSGRRARAIRQASPLPSVASCPLAASRAGRRHRSSTSPLPFGACAGNPSSEI